MIPLQDFIFFTTHPQTLYEGLDPFMLLFAHTFLDPVLCLAYLFLAIALINGLGATLLLLAGLFKGLGNLVVMVNSQVIKRIC